jgi:alpha-glucosidase (family GH31 glycosyl hydrolase)
LLEQEVCGRWLAFGALNPIMEVGPTRNVAFWNLPHEPNYDSQLIAIWRLYARLHERLIDYTTINTRRKQQRLECRSCDRCLVDPAAPQAWSNWWTYQYGRDLLVSPIWEKGKRTPRSLLPGRLELA